MLFIILPLVTREINKFKAVKINLPQYGAVEPLQERAHGSGVGVRIGSLPIRSPSVTLACHGVPGGQSA